MKSLLSKCEIYKEWLMTEEKKELIEKLYLSAEKADITKVCNEMKKHGYEANYKEVREFINYELPKKIKNPQ